MNNGNNKEEIENTGNERDSANVFVEKWMNSIFIYHDFIKQVKLSVKKILNSSADFVKKWNNSIFIDHDFMKQVKQIKWTVNKILITGAFTYSVGVVGQSTIMTFEHHKKDILETIIESDQSTIPSLMIWLGLFDHSDIDRIGIDFFLEHKNEKVISTILNSIPSYSKECDKIVSGLDKNQEVLEQCLDSGDLNSISDEGFNSRPLSFWINHSNNSRRLIYTKISKGLISQNNTELSNLNKNELSSLSEIKYVYEKIEKSGLKESDFTVPFIELLVNIGMEGVIHQSIFSGLLSIRADSVKETIDTGILSLSGYSFTEKALSAGDNNYGIWIDTESENKVARIEKFSANTDDLFAAYYQGYISQKEFSKINKYISDVEKEINSRIENSNSKYEYNTGYEKYTGSFMQKHGKMIKSIIDLSILTPVGAIKTAGMKLATRSIIKIGSGTRYKYIANNSVYSSVLKNTLKRVVCQGSCDGVEELGADIIVGDLNNLALYGLKKGALKFVCTSNCDEIGKFAAEIAIDIGVDYVIEKHNLSI